MSANPETKGLRFFDPTLGVRWPVCQIDPRLSPGCTWDGFRMNPDFASMVADDATTNAIDQLFSEDEATLACYPKGSRPVTVSFAQRFENPLLVGDRLVVRAKAFPSLGRKINVCFVVQGVRGGECKAFITSHGYVGMVMFQSADKRVCAHGLSEETAPGFRPSIILHGPDPLMVLPAYIDTFQDRIHRTDLNPSGTLFGGVSIENVIKAGTFEADLTHAYWSSRKAIAASTANQRFALSGIEVSLTSPGELGDRVHARTSICSVRKHSLTVHVELWSTPANLLDRASEALSTKVGATVADALAFQRRMIARGKVLLTRVEVGKEDLKPVPHGLSMEHLLMGREGTEG